MAQLRDRGGPRFVDALPPLPTGEDLKRALLPWCDEARGEPVRRAGLR